ncbi:hypothetical protein ACVWY2_009485 [Bradyrhizobium sp. JR6.1]
MDEKGDWNVRNRDREASFLSGTCRSGAEAAGLDQDSLCRSLLGLVVSKYLEARSVSDVQSELRFVADNCDPDTDFAFMRP